MIKSVLTLGWIPRWISPAMYLDVSRCISMQSYLAEMLGWRGFPGTVATSSHAANTSSNLVGDASYIKDLGEILSPFYVCPHGSSTLPPPKCGKEL